jgi:riboflavin kinase/FMN adenylyltransferase
LEKAKSENVPCCIWSFSEPPKRYYNPNSAPLLTSGEEKERIFTGLGVDIYLSVEFNQFIADLAPDEFFYEYLLKRLDPICIVCGYDFTFGKKGSGNTQTLRSLCEENGVEFISVSPVDIDGTPVSSSAIREYLSSGEIEKANAFLGRRYSVSATVIDGKHLGRKLGFPTVNQQISHDLCIPANGVYLTEIFFDGAKYFGITNVGTQPTVGGKQILFETNIFDFSGDLYGKTLRVEFIKFIRFEKKFNSLDELTNQIDLDVSHAKGTVQSSF